MPDCTPGFPAGCRLSDTCGGDEPPAWWVSRTKGLGEAVIIWTRLPLRTEGLEDLPVGPDVDWRPDLDVYETPDEYVLCLSLPGTHPESVELLVSGQTLSISGHRPPPVPAGATAHLIEAPRGRFERRVRLPPGCALGEIRSEMANGELLVRVPKRRVVASVQITVRQRKR